MASSTFTVGIFACIFDDAGRVLLVQQRHRDGIWTQPGGGLEAGEDPELGLAREVLEETGYRIAIGKLIEVYVDHEKRDLVLSYQARIVARIDWAPTDEISDIAFFALDALPEGVTENARLRIAAAMNEIDPR